MYCLGCGTNLTNQQANRRVVSSHSDIVDLWKTVVSEWDEQYTSAEDIVQEQPYMCRGCFSAYSRFIRNPLLGCLLLSTYFPLLMTYWPFTM